MQTLSFPAAFVEEAVFTPSYVLDAFVKNQVGIAVWLHIWVFSSVPLVYKSVFVLVPCCFYCYGSVVQFEAWDCDTSNIAFFAQCCLGYS
jgi:hypothetical protein